MEQQVNKDKGFNINTIMIWLFLITLAMLFIPFDYLSADLAKKINANKQYLYLALIIEVSNFIAMSISQLYYSNKYKRMQKQINTRYQNYIANLDFAERALLREFVLQRKSVLTLPIYEPTVRQLIDNGILHVVTNFKHTDSSKVPVVIATRARPFITYKAIGLTRSKMSDEMIKQIMDSRPEYAREIKPQTRAYRGIKAA